MSTVDRSVGHDEYLHRRRANCNDDRRLWRMDHAGDLQMGWKQNNGLHCKWTVKRRCLLKIEVLNTTIDEVQIESQGENQLRLGVIY